MASQQHPFQLPICRLRRRPLPQRIARQQRHILQLRAMLWVTPDAGQHNRYQRGCDSLKHPLVYTVTAGSNVFLFWNSNRRPFCLAPANGLLLPGKILFVRFSSQSHSRRGRHLYRNRRAQHGRCELYTCIKHHIHRYWRRCKWMRKAWIAFWWLCFPHQMLTP